MLDADDPVAENRLDPRLLALVEPRPLLVVVVELDRLLERLRAADRDLRELLVVRRDVLRIAQSAAPTRSGSSAARTGRGCSAPPRAARSRERVSVARRRAPSRPPSPRPGRSAARRSSLRR